MNFPAAARLTSRSCSISTADVLRALIPVVALTLVLDLEFPVATITGGGERVAYAADLVNGVLVPAGGQVLPVKISDLFLILVVTIVFLGAMCRPTAFRVDSFSIRQFLLLQLFAFTGLVALILNSGSYTDSQFFVCLAYLAKFVEISLVYLLVYRFVKCGGNTKNVFKMLALATGIAASIGIVNNFLGYFSGWLIQDRIQFYGILTLLNLVWLSAILLPSGKHKDIGINHSTLIVLVLLTSLSVMMCGKRTVMLSLVVGMAYIFVSSLDRKSLGRLVRVAVFGSLVLFPFAVDEIARSFDRPSENIWTGLDSHYAERLRNSWIGELGIGGGLDYSLTERLAKWLTASDIFQKRPFIGGGFWGSQYSFGFIPDSAFFQIILETGVIGGVFIGIFFLRSWGGAGRRATTSSNPVLAVGCKAGIIAMLVMGIFANSVYVFSLFGIFLILVGLRDAMLGAHGAERPERLVVVGPTR